MLEYIRQRLLAILERIDMIDETRNKLYDTAVDLLNKDASPKDAANDRYGCMESVSSIIQKAFPKMRFPHILSTMEGYDYFLTSPSFEQIDAPEKGCIIISPTGTGNGNLTNGHVGIVGKNLAEDNSLWIMSNDSRNGLWSANYTVASWTKYYNGKGGMPVIFFRVV